MTTSRPEVSQASLQASGTESRPAAAALARWAVSGLFLVNGTVLASYYVRIPTLKRSVGVTDGQLGVALTVAALAALLGMQFAGALTARFGSARVARLSAIALPLSLFGVALTRDMVQLLVGVLVFGAIGGLLDVAMNAQAIAVERAVGRPIMNGCHAAWSIGAIIGSLIGGIATKVGWSLTQHYLWLGVVIAVFAGVIGRVLLPASADRASVPAGEERRPSQWRTGWSAIVLLFGAMGAAVLLCEGSVATWSGVFLHENRGATLATASLAYIGFAACEAAGRLVGDRLQRRFGAYRLVVSSGVVAIAGLALALGPWRLWGIVGFSILGLGLSTLLPVIFSAVGHSSVRRTGPASVAAAVSRFTTMSYAGILIGPVIIGWLAEAVGLGWTLAGLELLLIGVVVMARMTAEADQR